MAAPRTNSSEIKADPFSMVKIIIKFSLENGVMIHEILTIDISWARNTGS